MMQSHYICFEYIKKIKILFAGDWDELRKNLLIQTIVGKTYETMSRNQTKFDRTSKLSYLFLRNFLALVPKFYFWRRYFLEIF